MKIMYFNPKNCKYQSSIVLFVEDDIVTCLNKKSNYKYTESLAKLREFTTAVNPNWHGEEHKPLVKLIGFK